MFCMYCNKMNPEGASKCNFCGNNLQDTRQISSGNTGLYPPVNLTPPQPFDQYGAGTAKKSNTPVIIAICASVAVLVIAVILIVVFMSSKKGNTSSETGVSQNNVVDTFDSPSTDAGTDYDNTGMDRDGAGTAMITETLSVDEQEDLLDDYYEDIIQNEGKCGSGPFEVVYESEDAGNGNFNVNYGRVEDESGIVSSVTEDFDGDGMLEMMAVILEEKNNENSVSLQMYDIEEDSVKEAASYNAFSDFMGKCDEEHARIFLHEDGGTYYICGDIERDKFVIVDGDALSSYEIFAVSYENDGFKERFSYSQKGSSFDDDVYEEAAELAESIGMDDSASFLRKKKQVTFGDISEKCVAEFVGVHTFPSNADGKKEALAHFKKTGDALWFGNRTYQIFTDGDKSEVAVMRPETPEELEETESETVAVEREEEDRDDRAQTSNNSYSDVPYADEYIFPYSDREYLTYAEVKALSEWELRLAINELYARHGRPFTTEAIRNHFTSTHWYSPKYSSVEAYNAVYPDDYAYNTYENENRKTMLRVKEDCHYDSW